MGESSLLAIGITIALAALLFPRSSSCSCGEIGEGWKQVELGSIRRVAPRQWTIVLDSCFGFLFNYTSRRISTIKVYWVDARSIVGVALWLLSPYLSVTFVTSTCPA